MVKKHSVSDTARTASLTNLRRWPGNGVFGMKPNSGSDALPTASLPEDFFGQNRKLKRSRKTDLGVERSGNPDLGKKNPDLGAGSDAGQARPGSDAGQECGALGVGRARIGRAIERGWGEPSNEVGASHQTRLGEPVLRGWASQY